MLNPLDYGISTAPGGAFLKVFVAPRSSSNRLLGVHNGELKVALTAPPVEGAANKALLRFLADVLRVPKCTLSLTSGSNSRHKVVFVQDIDPTLLLALLEPGSQQNARVSL
ncbi:MAG: DUF167 domain-containing protein [Chloroflexota bacterium]|nr:DUF167 domain-containing protein [Chloroflexota bacterium]